MKLTLASIILSFAVIAPGSNPYNLPQIDVNGQNGTTEIQAILQIVFGIAGALALLFIIISGFRYIVSAGNPQEVAKAKNALIYAVVGLVVCILAEVIVTFVVGHL